MRERGPYVLAIGKSLTARIMSVSRPMMPKARRGPGHSSHSVGMPALAGDAKMAWSSESLVSALKSALSVHSHKIW